MKNNIVDLRNQLFDCIERLIDPQPETPMDCKTAEAVALLAKRLIETAEVEIKFVGEFGAGPQTNFISGSHAVLPATREKGKT